MFPKVFYCKIYNILLTHNYCIPVFLPYKHISRAEQANGVPFLLFYRENVW